MNWRIETLSKKKLVGINMSMSITENRTGELWKAFMSRRHEITNNLTEEKISMQIYEPSCFSHFDPSKVFVKWATVEVADFDHVPKGMEAFILVSGLYVVFEYKGSSADNSIFQHIFSTWLPNSDYNLDDRPHFELLGEKYRNNAPDSEEEIWIPIKVK